MAELADLYTIRDLSKDFDVTTNATPEQVKSLRGDLEVMSNNHEREVDMKDAIIHMLDR